MKLKKRFGNHADLIYAWNCVDELITIYGSDANLGDILENIEDNKKRWLECPQCNGAGVVKVTDVKHKKSLGFTKCEMCNGHKWVRIPQKISQTKKKERDDS